MREGISEIAKKFKAYNKSMMDIWEDYNFLNHYLPHIHNNIKSNNLPEFELEHLYSTKTSKYKKTNLYGVIDHLLRSVTPVRALLEAVSRTEHYIQEITFRVYRDYQYKLVTPTETTEQSIKLLYTIVSSTDKDEIIYKIAEEKIKSLFYGNPVDFFLKDKAKIGFGDYFNNNYKNTLATYAEIIARRNIYTHNNGKVDRKYKREVNTTTFRLGQMATIDKDYLKETIIVLRGMAVLVTKLVIENIYKAPNINNTIRRKFETFEMKYKDR